MKYSVEEFTELSLDEIISSMSEPDIAGIRVEPGMTDLGKVEKQSEASGYVWIPMQMRMKKTRYTQS